MIQLIALALTLGSYPLVEIASGDFGNGGKSTVYWQIMGPSGGTSVGELRQEIVKYDIRIIVKRDGTLTSPGYIRDLRFPLYSVSLLWQHPRRRAERRSTILIFDADRQAHMVHAMTGEFQIVRLDTKFFPELNSWLLSEDGRKAER